MRTMAPESVSNDVMFTHTHIQTLSFKEDFFFSSIGILWTMETIKIKVAFSDF